MSDKTKTCWLAMSDEEVDRAMDCVNALAGIPDPVEWMEKIKTEIRNSIQACDLASLWNNDPAKEEELKLKRDQLAALFPTPQETTDE